jgi:hypothetical protein
MEMKHRMKAIMVLCAGLAATLIAGTASAMIFPLFAYENADGADLQGLDLWFEVTDGGTYADFTFYNSSTIASNVANIYFEASGAGLNLGSASIAGESAGVDFNPNGNPANPAPGQAPLNWNGTDSRFRAKNPAPSWGILNMQPQSDAEWLKIRFDYGSSSYDEIVSDLTSGEFRVAQHVTGMPSSIWTVSGQPVNPVPLPASAWLLGSGLAGWAGASRIRRRRN